MSECSASRRECEAAARAWAPREPVLVVVSQVAWHEVWQRPQEFAMRAAGVHKVVFISPWQIHWNGRATADQHKSVRSLANGNLLVLSPLVLPGLFRWEWSRARAHATMQDCVAAACANSQEVRVLVNTPVHAPAVFNVQATISERLKVPIGYDIIDDFAAFPWCPSAASDAEARLLECARVITGTGELARRFASRVPEANPAPEFVPCGVEYDAFATPRKRPADLPAQGPVIGYYGTFSDRVDTELLHKIAVRFPNATLVLIGPVHASAGALPDGHNVIYLGARAHEALPAYAQAFDVALVPFRNNEATRSLNPVKLLEYLAAGAPVVSTPLPDVVEYYGNVVQVADTHEAFLTAISDCLAKGRENGREERLSAARHATWDGMTNRILEVLGLQVVAGSGDSL